MKKTLLTTLAALLLNALLSTSIAMNYNQSEIAALAWLDFLCDEHNNLNWTETEDPSLLNGITWGNDGRVERIEIASKGLSGKVDFSTFSSMVYLDCSWNQLTVLTLEGNDSLAVLKCNYNYLTSLEVRPLTSLTHLECKHNLMKSLTVAGLLSLTYVDCSYNLISELTLAIPKPIGMEHLNISYNYLTTVRIAGSKDDYWIEPARIAKLYPVATVVPLPQNVATAINSGTVDETGAADYYSITGVFVGRFECGQQPSVKGMYVRKEVGAHKAETVVIR